MTVDDGNGGTDTVTVDITVTPVNDAPVAEDDASLIRMDETAVLNVLSNDTDVDAGETATLQVTVVDGQVIVPGLSITLSDGSGWVSLSGRGELSFTPKPGLTGEVTISYTVDDRSGAINATDTADWVINVAAVDITDDASPDGATVTDNVLSSLDDLTQVQINGVAAVDGTVTDLRVSDGVHEVIVSPVAVDGDGSYSVTADLSGLDEGTLTVTAVVEDAEGNTTTTTDTILKDTVTEVTIDPVLIEDGGAPTFTGSCEPGATTVILTVNGTEYTATVDPLGSWSVTLPASLATDELSLSATATDAYGNTDTDTRATSRVTVTDENAGDAADIIVEEAGLLGGTDAGSGSDRQNSTFVLGVAPAALDGVTIGGSVADGALSGGTTVTLAQLEAAATTPVEMETVYGTLTITGYDSVTGTVSYTYALDGNTEDHSDSVANDTVSETILIASIDEDGDTWVDHLVVGIVDDAPETPQADTAVSVEEGGAAVGSASGGDNLLANDALGADGGQVHQVTYTDRSGDSATITLSEGGSETVETQYGELTVGANGSWSYTPLDAVDHDILAGDDLSLTDNFSYTTIDGDGDVSSGSATQIINVSDTVPELGTPDDATVDEANLAWGSDPDAEGLTQEGSLKLTPGQDSLDVQLTTDSAPVGLSSGGAALRYVLSSDGHTLTADTGVGTDPVFVVTLTDPTKASAGYSFELLRPLDHGGDASLDLTFGVEVTDSDGDTDTASFTVGVVDDEPVASITRTVDEDSEGFSVNTSADATSDNTGIDQGGTALAGTAVTGGIAYDTDHGTVTVSDDGQVSYMPDANFSGIEEFTVVTDSDDGASTSTVVTVTVTPVADAPTLSVEAEAINTVEDTAVALGLKAPTITDDGTGTGNNTTPERIGAITLSGLPEGAMLSWGGSPHTVDNTGTVTIQLTDADLTVTGTFSDLSMSATQFEALEVTPPADSSTNFEVTYRVSSYEVDASGNVLVATGAESSESVMVYVQAATDDASLVFDTSVDIASVENAVSISYDASGTEADVTLAEDTRINLSDMLTASFTDLDGSEVRSITVTNTTGVDIVVNGVTVYADAADGSTSITVPAAGLSTDATALPEILIGGTADFSGDLEGITVTLNAQDRDADGYLSGGTPVSGPVNGIAEVDTSDNSVVLNLYVTPVADDVSVSDVTTEEDTSVAFLAGVRLTDTSTGSTAGGEEVITAISFDIPTGWVVTGSTVVNGASAGAAVTDTGTHYSITFVGGTQAEREEYLDGFTITPPAHDSSDATITLSVSTADTSIVNGTSVSDTDTQDHDLVVTVTPVAEVIGEDSDGDTVDDLTMAGGFSYSEAAEEDIWFGLKREGFDLSAGWSNQDSGEETFARLTPELIAGDGTPANAIGSMFRWVEGGETKTAIYSGDPIDVPVASLGSLEFRAVANFSGQFQIKVQAYTVDTDDDGGAVAEAVSGEAILENLIVAPVADEVTLSLAARTQGNEDTDIPLVIRPTSSDPSETFDVTISDIPDGAVVSYNGTPLAVSGGSVTIEGFDSSLALTIRPPLNSNEDFTLTVSAESVDRLTLEDDSVLEDRSPSVSLEMSVEVKGVADLADVTITPETYVEGDLDGGLDTVALSDLVSVSLTDADGSESLTMQVTGLPEGFGLTQGILLTGPEVTGEDRVWVLREAQFGSTDITVPENFSGTVEFSVTPVTTENDGASLTDVSHDVSFSVTPTPEATVTTSATLVEDTLQSIGLGIVHQNGDTDEILDAVRIRVSEAEGGDFTLYLDGTPLSGAGMPTVDVAGELYYELTAAEVARLEALGAANLDGDLGGFDLFYKITDPGDGSVASVTGDWIADRFELSAIPVTDQPVLTIDDITIGGGVGSVSGSDVTVTTAGEQVTVDLNIASPDSDGSEHLIRVIVEGVPEGVTVEGGEMLSTGNWLLVYEGSEAVPIDDAGGLVLPVVFTVGQAAGGLSDQPLTITVQTQDRGDRPGVGTDVLEDSIGLTLTTSFASDGSGVPPRIDTWDYTGAVATEDTSFQLSEMIDAQVTAQDSTPSVLTVTLTDLPAGSMVTGMIRTLLDGQEVWTASVTTDAGDDAAAVQAKLDALMDGIVVEIEANANDNNLSEPFSFNATLTTAEEGGGRSDRATETPEIPVDPVTDPAEISIVLGSADADGVLTETDSEIPLTLTVTNTADGAAGSIEGDTLYLQLEGTNGLSDGELTIGGETVTAQVVSGVEGIPDGTYYVIDNVTMGTPLDMVFTPDDMTAGSVTVDAWVRNIETGATALTSTGTATLPVEISNDGVALVSAEPVSGQEAADTSTDSLIALDMALALTDDDGSETITTVLLSNLPEGFLLYTGTSASDADLAEMATNAGGTGGTNTWVLTGDGGEMPAYVAILPPKHWSGTLDSLELHVTSGETSLSEARVDVLPLPDVTVTPVANSITLTPTNSFGLEGNIVSLNLNAAMTDFKDASVAAAADESVETVTLTLQGLGQYASFYVGTTLVTEGISYDVATDSYTLTGLSQSDMDDLGVRQASDALTDMVAGTAGVQISVSAHTVDGTDVSADSTSTITLNLSQQLETTGDDTLIWTGSLINGWDGEDTVGFRQGESLSGATLETNLRNIETLDLGIEGGNSITGLTADQVAAMTDGDNLLTIRGTAEDGVSLSGDWIDNGDGTYTGAVGGGGEVILTVEDVSVTAPDGGFIEPVGPSFFAMSAGFGLAALDVIEETVDVSETDPISIDELLSSDGGSEDLTAALPEEDTAAASAVGGTSGEDGSVDPMGDLSGSVLGTTLEDELQSSVVYEV
ncbi:beta strand repeat-containing protein [Pseudodonghicola xiamenensis]|uniref:beta strand repeat-containing protein n=1 Tax=Pseudodonghicola xiamenensis TaxID=337702 RepID=UPI001E5F3F62|nr:Ig-like domain-containing protein [Pseudodonghicola xiamenensis]